MQIPGTQIRTVLSVDPGLRGSGVALFSQGVLQSATYLKSPAPKAASELELVREGAFEISHWTTRACEKLIDRGDFCLIVERPQVYRAGLSKGDNNDLIPLAALGGALSVLVGSATSLFWVFPRDWKGQQPKNVTEQRVKKALDSAEFNRIGWPGKSLEHNVIDAVGIGLSALGRLQAEKVIPR